MIIAVPCQDGQICDTLSACPSYLLVTVLDGMPSAKRLVPCEEQGATAMLRFMNDCRVDVLICGKLGLAARNALEMLGVLLVPGCSGAAEEAVARFIVGEKQGDPTILELAREEDPDDPMACMHDCAKCAGCGPIEILKSIPEA